MDWYTGLGIRPDHLTLRPHDADELSHYSSATSDVEYLYPIGWSELEGIANRGDFDLTQHAEYSGEKLEYFDQQTGERYVPHVIEPAAGVGRTVLAFLCDAYDEDDIGGEHAHGAPAPPRARAGQGRGAAAAAQGRPPGARARDPRDAASAPGLQSEYDEGGSIGKRYRRQDEIGTPYGVTVDHQTLEDDTVTLRDRDTLDPGADRDRRAPGRARTRASPRRGARRSWPDRAPDRVRSALHGRGRRRHGLQPRGPPALPRRRCARASTCSRACSRSRASTPSGARSGSRSSST